MKKHLLFLGLLVFPSLAFLVTHYNYRNQTTENSTATFCFSTSAWKKNIKTNWNREEKNKAGRQITYFWEEQVETQTQL